MAKSTSRGSPLSTIDVGYSEIQKYIRAMYGDLKSCDKA